MATSEKFAQWDIVAVPFPYTDRLTEKRRPALVISKPAAMSDHGLLWVVMITSAKNERWKSDIEIEALTKSGLSAPSVIRIEKVATIERERVSKKVGSLGSKEKRAAIAALSKILG